MAKVKKTDESGLMYGLNQLEVNGKVLGFIEDDSFDFGGTPGEGTDIMAAQVKGAPVKTLAKSNGTIKPTFDLIQIDYEVMVAILGGALKKDGATIVGWEAPTKAVVITGQAKVTTDSGHLITIPNCQVQGNISGPLSMSAVSKIKCTLNVLAPTTPGVAPYTIEDLYETTT